MNKKTLSVLLIILMIMLVSAESLRTGTQTFKGTTGEDERGYDGSIPGILRQHIPGINSNNQFDKISEYLDGNNYLDEDVVEAALAVITRTGEGEKNHVHELLDEKIDKNFQLETATTHLGNVIERLTSAQQIQIKPNENYNNIKDKVEIIEEKIKNGLRSGDTRVIDSIAEYVADKSKGYEARHIASVVNTAREHLSSGDLRNHDAGAQINALFDSFDEGVSTINNMLEASPVVSEARTNLRTNDNINNNYEIIEDVLVPHTNMHSEDEDELVDGHIIHDLVYYSKTMNEEEPRVIEEDRKVHMNLMLDLLKNEMSDIDINIDHDGENTSPGGFLSGVLSFFETATAIISIFSEMFFGEENPFAGLGELFSGFPAIEGFTDEGSGFSIGSAASGGTSSTASATSTSSASTSSETTSTSTEPISGGPGAERILEAALGAEGAVSNGRLYGKQVYTSTTQGARYACAAVVSAILNHAGTFDQFILLVSRKGGGTEGLEEMLPRNGYSDIRFPSNDQMEAGDIVYWRSNRNSRSSHIGVIVEQDSYGKWWAIDNSSNGANVLKRPVERSYYPVVAGVARYQN
ncbi:MAG: hypothetical protein ACQESP_04695 [Candidatus Muiribacteriota bacterium]